MTQLLFTLDKPSKSIESFIDYLPYAFMVLDTSKEIEEGTRVVYFGTKYDWECNRALYAFADEEMIDLLYEYTVKVLNK